MTLPGSMDEVLSLTKAGRLNDATALIQRLLHRGDADEMRPAPREGGSGSPDLQTPLLSFDGSSEHQVSKPARGRAAPATGLTRQLYEGREGRIAYRLFVPPVVAAPAPLLIMLHGCTQSPEDFARGTRMNELAVEMGFLVAYPEQTNAANPQKCWNWFRPGDQERGRGEPALIAALTKAIMSRHPVDPERVYVAGLSAGGAAAAIMAAAYPDLYAAVGIHSGLAYGSANDVMSAFSAMQGQAAIQRHPSRGPGAVEDAPRVIVFHGSADSTVHPSNADRIIASLKGAPARMERSEHPAVEAGRGYTRTVARRADGARALEAWIVDGAPHAWFGGDANGSYTDPKGPNASAEMVRFFLAGSSPDAG